MLIIIFVSVTHLVRHNHRLSVPPYLLCFFLRLSQSLLELLQFPLCLLQVKKVKVWFYIAQYPVRWTAKSQGSTLAVFRYPEHPRFPRWGTRFAGTVIRPGYQFLPRFGDLILGLASLLLTNMFKQIKQIRITLMTMFEVYTMPTNEVAYANLYAMTRNTGQCLFCAWLYALCCVLGRWDSLLPNLLIAIKSAVSVPTELKLPGHHV